MPTSLSQSSAFLRPLRCSTVCAPPDSVTSRGIPTPSELQVFTEAGNKSLGSDEAIPQRVLERVTHDLRVIRTQELLQASRIHGVRPDHVRQGLRWNRRDLPLP